MEYIREFQNYAIPVALGLIIVLGGLLLGFGLFYLGAISKHARQRTYVRRNQERWQQLIKRLFSGELKPDEVRLSARERGYVRGLLVDSFFERELECDWDEAKQKDAFAELKMNPDCQQRAREIYVKLGFLADDRRELRSRKWWHRVRAVERIEDMGLAEAEPELLELLSDKKREVRFASLKALASIGSKRFYIKVPEIFSSSSTWSYEYLVNMLYFAGLPLQVLSNLAETDNPYMRKAAAILLGQRGKEAIPLLSRLAEDELAEVRREAVNSLARIGSPAAVPVFWRKTEDPEPEVRTAVAKGMGELGHIVLLQKLSDDKDFEVRFQAFASLSKMGMLGREAIKNYQGRYADLAQEFLQGGAHA